ncbi:hypothetical protein Anas_13064, partial [Armadillidium nasatum]
EEDFFIELEEEVPFCFLNKVLKWFFKTDENIKEWIKNIVYSPITYYRSYNWFDRVLKYRGYSDDEASDIKREIIFGKLPEIAKEFYTIGNNTEDSFRMLLVLSLLKKEEVLEFNEDLRSFYEDSFKQKICLWCLNNNFVYGIGEEEPLYCEHHGTRGFITLDEIDSICSSVKNIDYLVQKYEWRNEYDNRNVSRCLERTESSDEERNEFIITQKELRNIQYT